MLEDLSSGTRLHLASRHLIGRSRSCHLCIVKPNISGVHAEIVWDGSTWQLQDLGSRNGTFLDGRKLLAGEQAVLSRGAEIVFGIPRHRYRLTDDSPPRLMATTDSGDVCLADGEEMLCLPSLDRPELMIFRDSDERWVADSAEGTRELHDQSTVFAGGRSWRVCLPALHSPTRDAEAPAEPTLDEIALEFRVSRDGEHIGMTLVRGSAVRELESRAHAYLLLTLARSRLEDREQAHLTESEHGWVHRDELIKMLAIDPQLLNLWVYRARRQFTGVGIRGAANVIERRAGSHQMRIGIATLSVG